MLEVFRGGWQAVRTWWHERGQRWRAWRSLGARAERLAARWLRRRGYTILGRNLRAGRGEVDLLALAPDRRTVVVVEVKAGQDDAWPAEGHVTPDKQRRLVALAHVLCRQHRLQHRPVRFDVIAVHWPEGGKPTVRHHPGAFESHV